MEILTPEQIAILESQGACPYWKRVNPTGWCVEKWWAGGPAARVIDGLAVVSAMAILGFIIAEATRIAPFSAALDRVVKAKNQVNFLTNPPRRRARRKRRGRR